MVTDESGSLIAVRVCRDIKSVPEIKSKEEHLMLRARTKLMTELADRLTSKVQKRG